MYRIGIFASGSGTNAQRFFEHFANHHQACVSLLLCNKPDAAVIAKAHSAGIESFVFTASELRQTEKVFNKLTDSGIDFIVLAGFMLLLPEVITRHWEGRIVNIHPALLPKYGGKGMYGEHVHRAVLQAGDTVSGITIHLVNSIYDDGAILFQAQCPVLPADTPETLAQRIHSLEHRHYPPTVEALIKNTVNKPKH